MPVNMSQFNSHNNQKFLYLAIAWIYPKTFSSRTINSTVNDHHSYSKNQVFFTKPASILNMSYSTWWKCARAHEGHKEDGENKNCAGQSDEEPVPPKQLMFVLIIVLLTDSLCTELPSWHISLVTISDHQDPIFILQTEREEIRAIKPLQPLVYVAFKLRWRMSPCFSCVTLHHTHTSFSSWTTRIVTLAPVSSSVSLNSTTTIILPWRSCK